MPIPKRFFCFIWEAGDPLGGLKDCVGSANTIVDAVKLIREHDNYYDGCECEVWDIWDDQLMMNERHIKEYVLTTFQITNK